MKELYDINKVYQDKYLGNVVKFVKKEDNKLHYYLNDEEINIDTYKFICKKCNRTATINEPDPCLGKLPGVNFACCGHGNDLYAYINFKNGITIRGFNKIEKD